MAPSRSRRRPVAAEDLALDSFHPEKKNLSDHADPSPARAPRVARVLAEPPVLRGGRCGFGRLVGDGERARRRERGFAYARAAARARRCAGTIPSRRRRLRSDGQRRARDGAHALPRRRPVARRRAVHDLPPPASAAFIADAAPAALRVPAGGRWTTGTPRRSARRAAAPAGSAPLRSSSSPTASHGASAATLALTLRGRGRARRARRAHGPLSSLAPPRRRERARSIARRTRSLGAADGGAQDARRAQAAVRADELRRHLALLALDRGGDDAAAAPVRRRRARRRARACRRARRAAALRSVAPAHSFGGASVLTRLAALSERPPPPASRRRRAHARPGRTGSRRPPRADWLRGSATTDSRRSRRSAGAPPHLPPASHRGRRWQQYGWYQQWSANPTARAAPLSTPRGQGCGHQGLCDVARGAHASSLLRRSASVRRPHAPTPVVLGFLRNARSSMVTSPSSPRPSSGSPARALVDEQPVTPLLATEHPTRTGRF